MCHRGGEHRTMRGKSKKGCIRQVFHKLNSSKLNEDGLLDVGIYNNAPDGQNAKIKTKDELLRAKFALSLDGSTLAGRLPALLAGGQVVLLDDTSPLYGHFYQALRPWVHFVPISRESYAEIFTVTRFLIEHDELAQSIAEQGREFALKYTTRKAAICYIQMMLHAYGDLMQYVPRPPGVRSVSLRDAITQLDIEMKRTDAGDL